MIVHEYVESRKEYFSLKKKGYISEYDCKPSTIYMRLSRLFLTATS